MERPAFPDWTEADVDGARPTVPYFDRKIKEFGEELRALSGATSGYCAVTGIVPTQFTAIYMFGGVTAESAKRDIANEVAWIESLDHLPAMRLEHDWLIPLVGQHELYGFYKLVGSNAVDPTAETVNQWSRRLEELSDHNYTRRVQFLSEPFSIGSAGEEAFSEAATQRRLTHLTALSFGADGAVLRRYDKRAEMLRVMEFEGEMPDDLIADRRPGELLSGAVLSSSDYDWTVLEIGEEVRVRGCQIAAEAVARLRKLGVRAAITARLVNPLQADGVPFGTLAYFFNRPNKFSWRDVTLFLAFTKRASDVLALAMETTELRERNRLIENQSSTFTQAEVATLLVHDIAHKVFHVSELGVELIDSTKRQLRHYRSQLASDVATSSAALQDAINVLQREVQDLRVVGKLNDVDSKEFGPSTFSLRGLIDELTSSMTFPLGRYNITTKIDVPQDLNIQGARRVLYHILLNLLLNSIDAVRGRGRPASVHMTIVPSPAEYVKLRYWDTGPGINLSRLETAADIFKIGKTTKVGGTGLGLPMARNLLHRYFNGSLNLVDSKSAVFEVEMRKHND